MLLTVHIAAQTKAKGLLLENKGKRKDTELTINMFCPHS